MPFPSASTSFVILFITFVKAHSSTPGVKNTVLNGLMNDKLTFGRENNYRPNRRKREIHQLLRSPLIHEEYNDDDHDDKNIHNEDRFSEDTIQCTIPTINKNSSLKPPSNLPPVSKQQFQKTGTTIVGCITDSGKTVILAADTRATSGSVVADKLCSKVHRLASNVWCCGAGTSGDIDALVRSVEYTFVWKQLYQSTIGNNVPKESGGEGDGGGGGANVSAICNFLKRQLYENRGGIGANLILAGFEPSTKKAVLTAIHPHGSMEYVPYAALGSGGLAAMSILESRYRNDMTAKEGMELVQKAVLAGIENDLGSGSQIDICILKEDGITYTRGVVLEEVLSLNEGESNLEQVLYERHSKGGEERRRGVCGFGSLPYRIQKRRFVLGSEEATEKERKEYLNKLLGLEDDGD